MLSGCSANSSTQNSYPDEFIPRSIFERSDAPPFDVELWGDYPDYLSRLYLALEKCNLDKNTVAELIFSDIKHLKLSTEN
ncbi:hypothetical protein DVQ80_19615 [Yersinia enterocolitica]|nr:hypothetical protein [Yersinia enterocolitica]